ncbi:MAG: Maf family nucleotide pyrophosphatase [Brumimicrobium sp.]
MFSKKVILGSSSPRRMQLIQELGFEVEIRKKEVDENHPDSMSLYDVPEYLSKLKAEPLKETLQENEVLITSDTVVIFNGRILGKPKNREEAIETLKELSGKEHDVVSGVYIYTPHQEKSFSEKTTVYFKVLSQEEIEYYVDQYQPFDKAGAYGIQEWIGMIGVKKIVGDFYNVMGLPVQRLWDALSQL